MKREIKTKKLKELFEIYNRSPKMLSAVREAITEHSENAEAIVVGGLPSYRKNSNMYHACTNEGWDNWDYYTGAHRQQGTQGFWSVCVKK